MQNERWLSFSRTRSTGIEEQGFGRHREEFEQLWVVVQARPKVARHHPRPNDPAQLKSGTLKDVSSRIKYNPATGFLLECPSTAIAHNARIKLEVSFLPLSFLLIYWRNSFSFQKLVKSNESNQSTTKVDSLIIGGNSVTSKDKKYSDLISATVSTRAL